MKELEEELRASLETYFDKKLRKSSYSDDQEIWDIIETCIQEVQYEARYYERKVDELIEDNESDYMPSRYEMMQAYDNFREDQLGG